MSLRDDVPAIVVLLVGVVGIFVFALLLEIRQIWVKVQGLVEVMDFVEGENLGSVFQHFVVKFQAKLSFSVVDLEGIAIWMALKLFVGFLVVAVGVHKGCQQ